MREENGVMKRSKLIFMVGLVLSSGLGCGGEAGDGGTVQIFVEPEDTIPNGITPGTGEEDMRDGWTVTYDRFLITIGNVRASSTGSDETLADPTTFVLNLKNAPAGGYVIATFNDASAIRFDRFGFDLPNAGAGTKTLAPTTPDDLALLTDGGYSIYFEGSISKPDGQSCPPGGMCMPQSTITFRWGLPAGTSFDDCATEDGFTGFAVPTGGAVQVKPTIHGDHWFFNNVTSGVELTERYAQYIADSDLNQDGETTVEELKQVEAAAVFPSPKYNLSGALGGPVMTAYDYVVAQARTLGDYQGSGECPTRALVP
jgi:hypothetical protein